jgi:hypothetical protein
MPRRKDTNEWKTDELWAHLERMHESSKSVLNSKFELPPADSECLWDSEALWVARELAAGRVQIVVPVASGVPGTAYVSMIDRLARRYPMVYFVPEDTETYQTGKETSSPMQCRTLQLSSTMPSTNTSSTSRSRLWNRRQMAPK